MKVVTIGIPHYSSIVIGECAVQSWFRK